MINNPLRFETGNWTPVLGGDVSESGQAYVSQTGKYTLIGNLCHCSFQVVLSTKGTISGSLVIKGLPFTQVGGEVSAGCIGSFNNLNTALTWMAMYISSSLGYISGIPAAAATSITTLSASYVTNTTNITGEFTFTIA